LEQERLTQQVEALRRVLTASLALAEELQAGTIEKVLAKDDVELALEFLLDVHFVNPSPVFCLDKTGDCSHPKATHMSILPGSRQGSCLCQSLMLLQ
jgi:hypothetical protein